MIVPPPPKPDPTVVAITDEERLRLRACGTKARLGERAARAISEMTHDDPDSDNLCAYRCPFAHEHADGEGDWHVGHTPSLESLVQMAKILRTR